MKNTEELILMKPSKELEKPIWEYRQEYFDFGETHINGSCGMAYFDSFDDWLDVALSIEKERLSRENVHASAFFSVRKSDNKIIGSVQLRHFLTPELEMHGGHIGFGIRPSERRKGYGKCQLMLTLDVARKMEIPKVMISCDKVNISSSKTIISCGGILTCETLYRDKEQQIFWIDLHKQK